jgi:hypothetical protein
LVRYLWISRRFRCLFESSIAHLYRSSAERLRFDLSWLQNLSGGDRVSLRTGWPCSRRSPLLAGEQWHRQMTLGGVLTLVNCL